MSLPAPSTVHEIRPYCLTPCVLHGEALKTPSDWVFDDAAHGLVREPFVLGGEDLVSYAARDIANAEAGFILRFSDAPFAEHQGSCVLDATWPESAGAVYTVDGEYLITGYLCPCVLLFFGCFPKRIYFQALPR